MNKEIEILYIKLKYPDRILHPNVKAHWGRKYDAGQLEKDAAYIETLKAMDNDTLSPPYYLILKFCPPDKRKRDLDNVEAALKHALDGVFEALGHDDSLIKTTMKSWGKPVKRGLVHVVLCKDMPTAIMVQTGEFTKKR